MSEKQQKNVTHKYLDKGAFILLCYSLFTNLEETNLIMLSEVEINTSKRRGVFMHVTGLMALVV